jgi:glycosyltransferase involved in cell wall biosynthesis
MNQIYVILGGVLWRVWGKRIGLWYAHGAVSTSLKVATLLTHTVFTSTPQGFRISSAKKVVTGQGIDMSRFVYAERQPQTHQLQLITVGRVSVSKQLETLLQACALLRQQGVSFQFRIVGSVVTEADKAYEANLRAYCDRKGIADAIIWQGPATQSELPSLLAVADLFIHDGVTNSLDKVLVEAVACGVPTISSNPSYRHIIGAVDQPIYFPAGDAAALVTCMQSMASLPLVDKNQFTRGIAQKVQREHSLPNLVSGIVGTY